MAIIPMVPENWKNKQFTNAFGVAVIQTLEVNDKLDTYF